MKNLKTKIILATTGIILILSGVLFWNNQNVSAQTAGPCKATGVKFIPGGTQPAGWYTGSNQKDVSIEITTTNCASKQIDISVVADTTGPDQNIYPFDHVKFPVGADNKLTVLAKAGETRCFTDQGGCHYYVELTSTDTGLTQDFSSQGITNGELLYTCKDSCVDPWVLLGTNVTQVSTLPCKALSAKFLPVSGYQLDGWYKDDAHPAIQIEIKTENCQGKNIEMSIVERDSLGNDAISGFDDATFPIALTNSLMIYAKAGEDECDGESDPDCHYFVELYKSDNGLTADYDSLNSPGNPQGDLSYNCQGITGCHDDWDYVAIGGRSVAKWFFMSTLTVKQGPFNTKEECLAKWVTFTNPKAFGKCTLEVTIGTAEDFPDPTPTTLTSENTGQFDNTGYDLLAPLPGLTRVDETTTFGDYLNIILKLAIGLAGALAVFMMVVGGVQYMTSDAFGQKEAGKKRMLNAIGGLLLALGSYMLLNTINPNLVNLKLTVDQVEVTLTADDKNLDKTEVPITTSAGYTMNGTFQSPMPSPGVGAFVATKLSQGQPLTEIKVNVVSKQATFSTATDSVTIPINIGYAGYSEIGQAKEGDNKTPKGTTTITSDRRLSTSTAKAVTDRSGIHNMGADFINFGATINGKDRGMGFHGRQNNTLGSTNGCIRMLNDDLVMLAPYMKTGVKVIIQ